ncbi:MAG TPA: AAA family ATPase [Tepidisphaeraceae bacterium]|jgi:predicted ATPase|nr:AAA family ATPase [Tepidisphaeraceae bacterium]
MITRLYAHNFRCYQNFSFDLTDKHAALIIGKNGSGKSTCLHVLFVLQRIARGTSRLKDLISSADFCRFISSQKPTSTPQIRFEVDLQLKDRKYSYVLALEMPESFREVRVVEESLSVDGTAVFTRKLAQVTLRATASFNVDWHIIALTVINERPPGNAIQTVRDFLASTILLTPEPSRMTGYSDVAELQIDVTASNIASTLRALLEQKPAAYSVLDKHIRERIADFSSLEFTERGESGKQLIVKFDRTEPLDFSMLSSGEKCFALAAVILAVQDKIGSVFCMWDEPDNHLALTEVNQFVAGLRKIASRGEAQLIVTSHNPEAIRAFSDENTFVFLRPTHDTPTQVRRLGSFQYTGSLVDALIEDELIG